VVSGNAHRYPVSAQCDILGIARSTYYSCLGREPRQRTDDTALAADVGRVYRENRSVYGARKTKAVLDAEGTVASRRRIVRVMKGLGIMSAYTRKGPRAGKAPVNEADTPDLVGRGLSGRRPPDVLVSDITYVKACGRWAYTCLLLDLANREIVGHGASWRKDASLVRSTFASVDADLFDVGILHTDRGSGSDNMSIDKMLGLFGIRRSLSRRAEPCDNAVAEATFKLYKAEFAYKEHFGTVAGLQLKPSDYVHWFNNIRVHSTLGYMTPVGFRKKGLVIPSK